MVDKGIAIGDMIVHRTPHDRDCAGSIGIVAGFATYVNGDQWPRIRVIRCGNRECFAQRNFICDGVIPANEARPYEPAK